MNTIAAVLLDKVCRKIWHTLNKLSLDQKLNHRANYKHRWCIWVFLWLRSHHYEIEKRDHAWNNAQQQAWKDEDPDSWQPSQEPMNNKTYKQLRFEAYVEHGVAKLHYKEPLTKAIFLQEAQYTPGTPNWVLHWLTSDWYSIHFELMSDALWMHSLYVVGVLTRFCSLVSATAWIGSKRRMTAIADFITFLFKRGRIHYLVF